MALTGRQPLRLLSDQTHWMYLASSIEEALNAVSAVGSNTRILWIACCLTAGEFGIAIYLVLSHGEIYALYLAVTYAIREKTGAKYHEVLVETFRNLYCKTKGTCECKANVPV